MEVSFQILFFRRPYTEADGKLQDSLAGETENRTLDLRLENRSPLGCCYFLEDIITSSVLGPKMSVHRPA